jgi:hypothetical protein
MNDKTTYEIIVKCISKKEIKSRDIQLDEIEYQKYLDRLNVPEGDYQLIMIKAFKE